MTTSPDPLGLTSPQWEALAESWNLQRYRGRQVFDALHRRQARDYGAMRELPTDLRQRLSTELPLRLPEIVRKELSADGSAKYGLRLADGALIEAVFMPGEGGGAQVNEFEDARAFRSQPTERPTITGKSPRSEKFTICLSSQTGCAVDCAFCVTGRLGGGRNLSAGEILGQLYALLSDVGRTAEGLRVVFMGMGEPFLNPEGVLPALDILFEMISPRHVTVSTSGITPAFPVFAERPRRPNLAVSINAPNDEKRARLMPVTRTYPLSGLVAAMRRWPLEPRRRITVEYVLIAGVNDAREDAAELARLLSGIHVKVNIIPLNEDPVFLPGWQRPEEVAIDRFVQRLVEARIPVTVRRSRGNDSGAACGRLKGRLQDPRGR
ncbi:MAG TPA: 23S rRNA (adenine(2503)-C(2))-methyltransferase RlmN, partial [Thermoanaerobaculia bacterium]|nr:23S rRNA (adenine(2503)-C(2))-methyltransferase RlmN [Thermoanaerobaculia bacterium]